MKNKKGILTVLAGAAVLLTACGTLSGSQSAVKKNGVLRIGMEGDWMPWNFHNEAGELIGYDTDIARNIAGRMGVEAEFVEMNWNDLFTGLESGDFDVVINGVGVTPERMETYDFSEPYGYTRTVVMVRSDNSDIASFEDLDGKKVANTPTSEYAVRADENGAQVIPVKDFQETMDLLASGEADATLNSEFTYLIYMMKNPDAEVKVAAYSTDVSPVGVLMRKGDDTLKNEINNALAGLYNDGTLSSLSIQYFGSDITRD